jgi:DNA invertase Pin-like site-specific DNA recombinase
MTRQDPCLIYVRITAADIRAARAKARAQAGGDKDQLKALLDELIAGKVTGHVNDCRRYAADEGLEVLAVYTDNRVSGNSRHRGKNQKLAGREAMLADLRERTGQRVIVLSTEVERLYRDMDESRELVALAQSTPITVRDIDDEAYDLTGVEGESRFNGAVDKAQRESGKVAKRRRNQERRRAEAGGYWGNEPFGYHKVYAADPETSQRYYTGQLVLCTGSCCPAAGLTAEDWIRTRPAELAGVPPCAHHGNGCWLEPGAPLQLKPGFFADLARQDDDDDGSDEAAGHSGPLGEAEWTRDAAEIVARGASLGSVMRLWENIGLTTRNGERWSQQMIRALLLNKRIHPYPATAQGIRVHRAGDKWGRASRTAEGTETPGQWPAILDEALGDSVRGVLTSPERFKHVSAGHSRGARQHLLAGLAECGNTWGPEGGIRAGQVCGIKMKGHPSPLPASGKKCACGYCGEVRRVTHLLVLGTWACSACYGLHREEIEAAEGPRSRQYQCPKVAGGCGHCRRDVATADEHVINHVLAWTRPGGPYEEFLAAEKALHDAGRAAVAAELAGIEAEKAGLTRERDTVSATRRAALRSGALQPDTDMWAEFQATFREIEDRKAELAARQAKLLASAPPPAPEDVRADLELLADPRAPVAVRAELVRRFVAKVIISPPGQGTRRVFDPRTVMVIPGPWADGIELAPVVPPDGKPARHARDVILEHLAGHPGATAREIAGPAGLSHSFACTVLRKLEASGEAAVTGRRPGPGTPAEWSLAS